MFTKKFALICVSSLVISSCASWEAEHEAAMDRTRAHSWNKMIEEHNTLPKASGPKWQLPSAQAERYLAYLRDLRQSDPSTFFRVESGQEVSCSFDSTSQAWLMYQQPAEALARSLAVSAKTVQRRQLGQRIQLLSGDCSSGRLEGPFSALYQDRYYSSSEYVNGETRIDGRIDGYFRNGVLDGEVRVISIDNSNLFGQPQQSFYYSIGIFDAGEKVGSHVTVAMSQQHETVYATQGLEQGRARTTTWMNDEPTTHYQLLNHQVDGWMEFASAVLKDEPRCFRAGEQQLSTAYCHQIGPALAQLMPVDPPSDYGRLEDIPGIDAIPTLTDAGATAASWSGTLNNAGPMGQRVETIPAVGFYHWLTLPAEQDLAANGTSWMVQRLQQTLSGDVTAQLGSTTATSCELSLDAQNLLLFQKATSVRTRERENQERANMFYEYGPAEIRISEGYCNNGSIDGRFVAHYKYRQDFTTGQYKAMFNVYGRVEGSFLNGELHGEVQRLWLNDAISGSMAGSEVGAGLAEFNYGRRIGEELHLLALPKLQATRLVQLRSRDDGREVMEMWLNGDRQVTALTKDGVNDGFIQYYGPAFNNMKQCYKDGQALENNGYCEQF